MEKEKLEKIVEEKKAKAAEFNKKKQDKIEKIFCRKVYPKISEVTSRISDAIPVSWNDVSMAAGLMNMVLKSTGRYDGVSKVIDKALKAKKSSRMIANMTALLNEQRKPLEEKLGLSMKNYNKGHLKKDIEMLSEKINEVYKDVDFGMKLKEVNKKGNEMLDTKFMDIEGYDFRNPKRTKHSVMMEVMSILGAKGLFDPSTNEVIIKKGKMDFFTPFAIVHEKAHSKGYIRENEANLMSYITCTESGEPNFMYSAYASRLNYTLKTLHNKEEHGTLEKAVEAQKAAIKALNVPDEMKEDMLEGYHVPFKKIVQPIRNGFAKFLDFQLKTRGQKEGIKGYSVGFIRAARAYERK